MKRKKDFMMVDRRASTQIIRRLSAEAPHALTLWLSLRDIANDYGVCVASQKALEQILGVKSRQTVYRAVRYLQNSHYIKVGHIGNQNAYILNPNIVWRTAYNYGRKRLSKHGIVFPGVITLTKSENRKLYDDYHKFIKENQPVSSEKSLAELDMKPTKQGKSTKNGEKLIHHNKYTSSVPFKANQAYKRAAKRSANSKDTKKSQRSKGKQAD